MKQPGYVAGRIHHHYTDFSDIEHIHKRKEPQVEPWCRPAPDFTKINIDVLFGRTKERVDGVSLSGMNMVKCLV